jgi:Zn finger protein HypA/HybF involved in hydrogenase expression
LVFEAKPVNQIIVKIGKVHKTKASIIKKAFKGFPLLRAKT